MWPWEHLALGYICYSGYRWLLYRDVPSGPEAVVLLFATQLPDIVDKPLAWTVGVLPDGTTLAHSLLLAVPLCLAVVLATRLRESPRVGDAFVVGYLSHLLGDMSYPLLVKGRLSYEFLLWPLITRPPTGETTFLTQFRRLVQLFLAFLGTPRGRVYLLFEAALVGVALGLWLHHRRSVDSRSND